jgi:hypothetical protein
MATNDSDTFDLAAFGNIRRVYDASGAWVRTPEGRSPRYMQFLDGFVVTYNPSVERIQVSAGEGSSFVSEDLEVTTSSPMWVTAPGNQSATLAANLVFGISFDGTSLVLDADTLTVGEISDAQHGTRDWTLGGGVLLHPEATTTTEGFMPRSDRAELMRQRAFTDPAIAADFTIDTTYYLYRIDPIGLGGGNITGTLPPTANLLGRSIAFKLLNAGGVGQVISLAADGTDTIDGAATYTFLGNQYESLVLYCARNQWDVISHDI